MGYPAHIKIQGILIAKLAVEVGNTGNTLSKVSLRLTASVYQPKNCPDQATVTIVRIRSDNFGAAYFKGNTRVFPRLAPYTGTGDQGMLLSPSTLNNRSIPLPHIPIPPP